MNWKQPSKRKTRDRNRYETSDGVLYTQKQIDRKRSEAYRAKHEANPVYWCMGCGKSANCNAHIISQSRCKQLRKTELIWNPKNFFPSCFMCNSAIENPKGEAWKKLNNIETCLKFIELHDMELYAKFTNQ